MQMGQAAIQKRNFPEALKWFIEALRENPKDPQINACVGQTLCWQGKRSEGIVYLRQSGQILLKKSRKDRNIALVLDLADQLQLWNDYCGSMELCRQAIQINNSVVRAYQLLALSHSRLNQKKPALAAGRQALKLAPDSAMLAILVATLEGDSGLVEGAVSRLQKVLEIPWLKAEESFRAHKELGRFLDKLGRYEQVFSHLNAAAQSSTLLPAVRNQNMTLVPSMLESHKAGFSRDLLGRWSTATFPADQPAPVFVLGFMRTGTTLTQEVLGAHPGIFVADETDLIMSMIQELARVSKKQGSLVDQLSELDFEGVLYLRNFYWQRAHALFGDKIGQRILLDKTTMNSIDLGAINCLFPDAKLVFLLRDPRDVCLSCFMQTMIPTPSTVHLMSWHGTARFYAQVMDWWLTVKPKLSMDFIEFRYEDAVFQFEPAFRKVFDFLGLEWDASVIDFYKNAEGKAIASPSYSQVSQPLYSSSVGRWKRYEGEFQPVIETLQPYLDEFGYQ